MLLKLNKFRIIIASVIIIVVIIGGFVVKSILSPKPDMSDKSAIPSEAFPTIEASVNIDLQFTNNNRSLILTVKNVPDGVNTIDYEISYLTANGIPKGNIGSIKVNGQKEVSRSGDELTLGTCSRGVCKYYEGVSKVSLSLKFNYQDGKVSIFQKEYPIK